MGMRLPAPGIDVLETARRTGHVPDGAPRGGDGVDQGTGPLLVDVRERDEFTAMRVPGVTLLPMSELGVRFGELPRDRQLLIMCAVGGRSQLAADYLLANGYPDVVNVVGGIVAWRAAGLPVIGGQPQPGEGDLPGSA
jgi:rhodanese-related sulfurtransferase